MKGRLGEVAEHRSATWLAELDAASEVPARKRLADRMDEVKEDLANKWLKELDARLRWQKYEEDRDDFCYGVGFGKCADCEPSDEHDACANYDFCKEEYEAEWPRKES